MAQSTFLDMIKDLTKPQQAAIYFHVVGGCNEWADLFQIAEGKERYNNLKDSAKGQTVSRWKNTNSCSKMDTGKWRISCNFADFPWND